MTKLEKEAENTLAGIIGALSLLEGEINRVRLSFEKHGIENYGASVTDEIVSLTRINRQIGKLGGMAIALAIGQE